MSTAMRDPHPDPRVAALPTPFHSRTSRLCRTNDWARWAGYTTVQVFTDTARMLAGRTGKRALRCRHLHLTAMHGANAKGL